MQGTTDTVSNNFPEIRKKAMHKKQGYLSVFNVYALNKRLKISVRQLLYKNGGRGSPRSHILTETSKKIKKLLSQLCLNFGKQRFLTTK